MSDLSQLDLSNLTLKQMTADQKAEMKRRLDVFVRSLTVAKVQVAAAGPKKPAKWIPGTTDKGAKSKKESRVALPPSRRP
ncbi:MAG TPA: hypothetical protein VNT30_05125 [Stellaceae bacterium]|nr:hypothetical protein [Stellaceae bacterium]